MTATHTQVMERKESAQADGPQRITVLTPAVDIREDNDKVVLTADLPGVGSDGLDVNIENQVLTIEGRSEAASPKGYEPALEEFTDKLYRRVFRLSERVDASGVTARLKHGVLQVVIPKREEAKPRKINIVAG